MRRDIESAKNIVRREITILNPSYVFGRDNNTREKEIKRIRILILDSLSATIPKNRDIERTKVVNVPITKIHEIPIPILIIETASYLAEIMFVPPSTIPISSK